MSSKQDKASRKDHQKEPKKQPIISPTFENTDICYEKNGVRELQVRKWHKLILNEVPVKGFMLILLSRKDPTECKIPIHGPEIQNLKNKLSLL